MPKYLKAIKIYIFSLLIFFCFDTYAQDRIVMVVADKGFQDEALSKPLKYFKDEGFVVDIASDDVDKAQGLLGTTIEPDIIIEQIDLDKYKAMVLIGSLGADVLLDSGALEYKLKQAALENKVIAAISMSPVTLAKAGILKDRQATVWPQESQKLIDYGADYVFADVVVDGRLVTASGPQAALDFAKEIVRLIKEE